MVIAGWEGAGPIDYGDEFHVVALRYSIDEVKAGLRKPVFS